MSNKKISFTVTLPQDEVKELDKVAEKSVRSRTGQVAYIISEYLKGIKK